MKDSMLSTSELKLTKNMDSSSINNAPGSLEEDTIIQLRGLGSNDFTLMEDDVIKPLSITDQIKKFGGWSKHKIKKSCTRKMLLRRVPILTWLPKYNSQDALGDFVAGITVGLTVIPQSLAYSNIAGLSPQYGLYGSFLGAMLYIIFGSCKDVPMGPTAIVSLLTYQAVHGLGPEYAILLCFTSGLIQLLMGIFGLGFMIDFVSGPVSSGFTSAVALIIVTSQMKDILGIQATGNTFLEMWISLFTEMKATRLWDTILGIACIIILLVMRLVAKLEVGPRDPSKRSLVQKMLTKLFWTIGTSRNAILVVVCGAIGFFFVSQNKAEAAHHTGNETQLFDIQEEAPFKLMGFIPAGLPEIKVPPFHIVKNDTVVTFVDMVSTLGTNMIVLPLIALLENIAICKAFSSGKPVDATQELIAVGICNIGNSFVQAFPGSGSLSRSAVNEASGVRTPLGGLYTGVLVIVALMFFTPYFYFIPKAALAVKGEIIPLQGDVSKESEILMAFEIIREKFGTIHILVNNAGVLRFAYLGDGDLNFFKEVIDVNIMGLTICTQQALKLMKESGVQDGHIININSIAGHYIPPIASLAFNVYPATKFAVTALTEQLRQELSFFKSKIKITSISPGLVGTELIPASFGATGLSPDQLPSEASAMFKNAPFLHSKDIADAVLYVLSTPPHVQVHELMIKPVGESF